MLDQMFHNCKILALTDEKSTTQIEVLTILKSATLNVQYLISTRLKFVDVKCEICVFNNLLLIEQHDRLKCLTVSTIC